MLAKLLEAALDGGFETEDSIVEARALAMALAGHIQRQTQCLEIVAQANLKEGVKLPDW